MMTSTSIPAWLVGIAMIYTGLIWVLSRGHRIRMDSRMFASAFIIWGIIYFVVFQYLGLDVEFRGFLSRLMILLLCISQSFPLTVSLIRSIKRGE
jgi:hypothetical protein